MLFMTIQRYAPFTSFRVATAVLLIALTARIATAEVARMEIDAIRSRNLLTQEDRQKLQDFAKEQLGDILNASSASALSQPVRNLTESAASKLQRPEARRDYSDAFTAAVKANYKRTMMEARTLPDKELALRVCTSIVVVVAKCDNIAIIQDLLDLLKDESQLIRYWAVKGLAMPNIQDYLSSDQDQAAETSQNIVTQFSDCLNRETSELVIAQIALAAPIRNEGVKLIRDCVAKRILQYQNWKVDNELIDLDILWRIFGILEVGRFQNEQALESELARTAVDLFAIAYQRYTQSILHRLDDNQIIQLITDESRRQLEALLIETEAEFLRVSRSDRRARFPGLIQKGKWNELDAAYKILIRADGPIDTEFKIFANNASGQMPVLPKPSQEVVKRAETLKAIQDHSIGSI